MTAWQKMNWFQKLFHSHTWNVETNESPTTHKTFPMYRTCTKCGCREILRDSVKEKVKDPVSGKEVEVTLRPKIWVPMRCDRVFNDETQMFESTTQQRYGLCP